MTFREKITIVLINEARFLFFRQVTFDMQRLGNYYLALGLLATLLAGMGRYWDNPKAELWQTFGLGSLAYVFILAIILWAIIKPLRPKNWTYKGVLIFVSMTSPPAILYAIPVERFFTLSTASIMNLWFLGVVAIWRIALLFQYLKCAAKLGWFTVFVAALLPLVIIVTTLTILNLEHVVFNIMAGITKTNRSGNDASYFTLLIITYFSVMATPVILLTYIGIIINQWRKRTAQRPE